MQKTPQMVLTLVAPQPAGLNTNLLESLRKDISGKEIEWLSPGQAAEFVIPETRPQQEILSKARTLLSKHKLDWSLQPANERRKKLLIADMDSTIVTGETLDELAAWAGFGNKLADITRRTMEGEISFANSLRERVAMLAGIEAKAAFTATATKIKENKGGRTLVHTMRNNGALTALVSGGFTVFTSIVRELVGFERDYANVFEIINDRLSGRVIEPILGQEAKLQILMQLASERNIPMQSTMAIGDGANDLAMIRAAGLGIAFHAKPIVAAESWARIDYSDLSTALFFQGYHHQEFVTH